MRVLLLAGCAGILAACSTTGHRQQLSGIQVESVRLTAANHYLDLRYRVVDADQARKALGPKTRPTLIDESTGTVMAVPTTAKLGSLRQTQGFQRTGRTYFVMFVNAGVRPGSRVTAELGDLKFKHLVVQ